VKNIADERARGLRPRRKLGTYDFHADLIIMAIGENVPA
jgi:hypothetical protein